MSIKPSNCAIQVLLLHRIHFKIGVEPLVKAEGVMHQAAARVRACNITGFRQYRRNGLCPFVIYSVAHMLHHVNGGILAG